MLTEDRGLPLMRLMHIPCEWNLWQQILEDTWCSAQKCPDIPLPVWEPACGSKLAAKSEPGSNRVINKFINSFTYKKNPELIKLHKCSLLAGPTHNHRRRGSVLWENQVSSLHNPVTRHMCCTRVQGTRRNVISIITLLREMTLYRSTGGSGAPRATAAVSPPGKVLWSNLEIGWQKQFSQMSKSE